MLTKSLTIEKMDEAGTGLARIAQLSAVDSDGDTYAPGAFSWGQGGGQWVQILPAHDRRAMPLGKAWLHEQDGWAIADFSLNLGTQAGSDWCAALRFDLAKGQPIQEWSYGFQILDADYQQRDGDQVRVLKKLDVDEISPVIRGAGVGTGTLAIKSAELKQAAFAPLIASLGELADATKRGPAVLSATGLKQLGEIHAAIGRVVAEKGTCPMCGAPIGPTGEDADQAAVEGALGGWLEQMSRGHLPA